MKTAVIIASTGRPDDLGQAVAAFCKQSVPASQIILSVVSQDDLPGDHQLLNGVEVVTGPKGLPAQRNTGLRALAEDADVIAFFDDDYLASRFCVEAVGQFFARHPDIAGANGRLLGDGINSAGIDPASARTLIDEYDKAPAAGTGLVRDLVGLYGCNMAYRAEAVRGLWFDERLKLYGWQEDIDFATRVGKMGRIVKTDAFAGVHLGTKRGRTPGLKLGYSQIINPLYLIGKGTMPVAFGLELLLRNLIANHLRALNPEPWVDRAGRVKGNWMGIADAIRGRLTPERIESLG